MNVIVTILILVAGWTVFKKMGRHGWEAVIPFYNLYVLFEELEGNGLKALYLVIPFVNIYWTFKICVHLAYSFNKETWFGIGLVFLFPIFICLLAFTDAKYLDGIYENAEEDFLTNIQNSIPNSFKKGENFADTVEMIERLNDLRKEGAISDEEYEEKKKDLLKKI